jgi:preprotein translocase subunit SecF
MELFKIGRTIPFMRHALILNAISFITFILAVFFIVTRGFHLSIEFTGGTVMEINYTQAAPIEQVRTVVSGLGYTDFQVQNFGTSRDLMIRLPLAPGQSSATQSETVMKALKAADATVELRRVEFVGPQVGRELVENGLLALLFVIIGVEVRRRRRAGKPSRCRHYFGIFRLFWLGIFTLGAGWRVGSIGVLGE